MERIQMLVMDVDGTLTDGKIYISQQGELFKAFDVMDGYGIRHILPKLHIIPVVITGRISSIVEHRCSELGISHCYQGIKDKAECLNKVARTLSIPLDQIACIGDDENDLPMLKLCGVKGCPKNGFNKVKENCDYICNNCGGNGAVREFIEWLATFTKKAQSEDCMP